MSKQVYIPTWVDKNVPIGLQTKFYDQLQKWNGGVRRTTGTYDEDVLKTMLEYAKES